MLAVNPAICPASIGNATTRGNMLEVDDDGLIKSRRFLGLNTSVFVLILIFIFIYVLVFVFNPSGSFPLSDPAVDSSSLSFKSGLAVPLASVTR